MDALSPAAIKAAQTQAAAQQSTVTQDTDKAAASVIADLNANDFADAWSTALSTSSLYDTTYNAQTTDPLLQALESSAGLEALDPSKKWTDAEINAYYQALGNNPVYQGKQVTGEGGGTESLGKNPYSLWGSGADVTGGHDASVNESTAGDNSAPDVERFAGARPDATFLDKFGGDIAALALTAVTAGTAAPLAGALLGGETALDVGAAGALIGTAGTAAIDAATGKPVTLKSLAGGALGGVGASGALSGLGAAVGSETGLGTTAGSALVGSGVGALKGELTGGDVGVDAALGGLTGAIQGSGLKSSASSAVGNAVGSPALGNVATSLGTGELTSLAGSTLTSSSGKGASGGNSGGGSPSGSGTTLSPGVAPVAGATVAGSATTASGLPEVVDPSTGLMVGNTPDSSSPGFISGLTTGLGNTLGTTTGSLANTLGQITGSIAPYAAVGALGMEQAQAGENQAAAYSQEQQNLAQPAIGESNTLLGNYQAGKINSTDAALSNTEIQQGQSLLNTANASGLSAIAQQAFASYQSGQLQPGQQAQLDAQVAAQKQAVQQQLASAGITDSTILTAQFQQIDNNALITKQQLLNSNFSTGVTAYDQFLQTTEQGQQTIQQGMTVASNSLQTELANSMAEANIGIGEMNTAITTQMQTDQQYAAQVSTLLGTLATAYAKQVAGSKSGSTSLGNLGSGLAGSGIGGAATAAAGGASTALNAPVTSGQISQLTSPATSQAANDVQQAGNAGLANIPEPTYLTDEQLGIGDIVNNPAYSPSLGGDTGSTWNLGASYYGT